MSKRNSDGDVLFNKLSVGLAKHQRLFAPLAGPKTEKDLKKEAQRENEEEDLGSEAVDPERIGLGGITPKDIEDGSFTQRIPTSNDKLLQRLMGNKAAKAHLAAKQTSKSSAKQKSHANQRSALRKEESEDEEEGRASAFKSKRRKTGKRAATEVEDGVTSKVDPADDMDLALHTKKNECKDVPGDDAEEDVGRDAATRKEASDAEEVASKARPSKAKLGSYLDEVLAERSKTKKKKKHGKGKTED